MLPLKFGGADGGWEHDSMVLPRDSTVRQVLNPTASPWIEQLGRFKVLTGVSMGQPGAVTSPL